MYVCMCVYVIMYVCMCVYVIMYVCMCVYEVKLQLVALHLLQSPSMASMIKSSLPVIARHYQGIA